MLLITCRTTPPLLLGISAPTAPEEAATFKTKRRASRNNQALWGLFSLALAFLLAGCASGEIKKPLKPQMAVRSAEFRQTLGGLMTSYFVPGNRITTLNNGAEIFPAMLAAIRGAKHSVTFETYVFEGKGETPQAFVNALAERARAGVKVHIIVDAVGGSKSKKFHSALREAGAEVRLFHPLLFLDPRRANNRTHRKLLIVDGRVGFIGGVGIAKYWDGDARSPEEWRDTHYRVQGPAVAGLQSAFHEHWNYIGGEPLQGAAYFPPLQPAGSAFAAIALSSPKHKRGRVDLLYHLSIASAQRSLDLVQAYFVPDGALLDALVAAAHRGVRVRVLVPGKHIDQPKVLRASRTRWPKLIQAGVEMYTYDATMIHTKLLIADGKLVSIGSANFDPRSLALNAEANLNVIDDAFAAEQTRVFLRDLQRAHRVTIEEAKKGNAEDAALTFLEAALRPQL